MLDLAILVLLHESSMHGYELRKQLTIKLGTFRAAISYGSLYPTLRRLQASGYITEGEPTDVAPLLTGKRGRVVYKITAEGKERFQQLLGSAGPETYDSEATFGVHFAFFARTDRATRLRILEGRRAPRLIHPGAPAPRPRGRRARGPVVRRADRQRAVRFDA